MKEDGSSKGKQPSNCLDLGEFLKEDGNGKAQHSNLILTGIVLGRILFL